MPENEIRLPDPGKLIVSCSPHLHDEQSVQRVMVTVLLALVPACVAGVVVFGLRGLWILAVCAASCVLFECLFARMRRQPASVRDCSALLTGILLGMNLSATTPWWVCVIGALLAIGLGKMIYGGLGYNPFNPALIGRVGLLIAFPGVMTTWVAPSPGKLMADVVTTATPLGELQTDGLIGNQYWAYFVGNVPGCVGEASALALLLGGIVLIYLKLIRWQVPLAFLASVAIITGIVRAIAPEVSAPPALHLLTGGLFLGAFFMATDMVTSPMSALGATIFGVGCGVLTSVIRLWGSYPEGVSFSILFMNALTPLIDRYTAARPFGSKKDKEVSG